MTDLAQEYLRMRAVQTVACALDKPSVYMGGPSRRSLSQAETVIQALEAGGLLATAGDADSEENVRSFHAYE